MILQLGALFTAGVSGLSNLFGGAAATAAPSVLSQIGTGLGQFATQTLLPLATDVGGKLLTGLAQQELTRDIRRAQNDAIKAGVQAATQAASPVVAPGQGPVFSGGTATGSPMFPSTIFPPSTVPVGQQLQVNPNLFTPVPTRFANLTQGIQSSAEAARQSGPLNRAVPSSLPLGQAPFRSPLDLDLFSFASARPPESASPPPQGPSMGTTMHRYTRNRDGTGSQLFVPNTNTQGANMLPIEQAQGAGMDITGLPRFRFDAIKRIFTKLKRRRMNPCNTRAFFRAGRRVDSMERIARNLFSEKKKSRNAAVKRKSKVRKKR